MFFKDFSGTSEHVPNLNIIFEQIEDLKKDTIVVLELSSHALEFAKRNEPGKEIAM